MVDSNLPAHPAGNPSAPEVDAGLLHIAFKLSGLNTLLTAIAVAVLALLLSDLFIPDMSRVWLIALMANVVSAAAALCAWRRRRPDGTRPAPVWRKVYLACSLIGGLAWSIGPALMLPHVDGAELALLVGILLSVCAVSANSRAAQPLAMYAFLVIAMVPAILASLRSGGQTEPLLALALLACLVALALAGRRAAHAVREQVTAQVTLGAALAEARAARAQAEAASLAKSRFLANMGHELRSPLNAVIGAAQLLKVEAGDVDSQGQWVDAIHRNSKNLLHLIDDVLDHTRIDAGQLTLSVADFNLIDCIESALATVALAARAKGLALACIVEPGLQASRQGDSRRIRQVVLNLLGNAVKFTPTGEIVLRIESGAREHGVCIRVSDTGVGIGAASLPHIFEPFRQADDGANRRFGGSGLGLSIVHQLAQAMGATIKVQSQPGSGTSFDIALHLPPAKQVLDAPAALGLAVADFEPHEPSAHALDGQLAPGGRPAATVQVLVVADDVLNQAIVGRMLSHGGCDSTVASNGAQAMAAGDHGKLRMIVHCLKSSSATVGALELSRLAQTHEDHLRSGLAPVQALPQLLAQAVGRLTAAVASRGRDSLPEELSA